MNRINQLFNSNKKDILSIYFCAGNPTLDGTVNVIRTLEKHGVSMIEVGIPFSDPMADGIVIQNAATQAFRNGMSLKILFEQLRNIRQEVSIPLVFMGYLNPIMQFGFENFCHQCVECGIDGVIIPDLPFRDYQDHYRIIAERYGIKVNRNGMCVCPFHNDKNPSMKVDRRFYCFGCGATGDVIDFVSRLHGISSKEP